MQIRIFFIPILTLILYFVILLNIPLLRQILVFVYLSFVPGIVLLKLFKLRINLIESIVLSISLSIVFLMLVGLLINEVGYALGIMEPLSVIPMTLIFSVFVLSIFVIEVKYGLFEFSSIKLNLVVTRDIFLLFLLMLILPIISIIGAFFVNMYLLMFSYALIVLLCLITLRLNKHIQQRVYPFLILSISLALVFQVTFLSKYIIGFDSQLEYFVFNLTKSSGHWESLNPNFNNIDALNYNAMLSITILPTIYSVLMNVSGEAVFKLLYPLMFSFVPLILYTIYEKQTNHLIGFLSVLFFQFTSKAFYAPEPLGLNRQIIGYVFFLVCFFLIFNKSIQPRKTRFLLIIFSFALSLSHYSLTFIFLGIVAAIYLFSLIRRKPGSILNIQTTLCIFGVSLIWYLFGNNSPLQSIENVSLSVLSDLTTVNMSEQAGGASMMFYIPQSSTFTTLVNSMLFGIVNVLLAIGIFVVILRPKRLSIEREYRVVTAITAVILFVSLVIPQVASSLNFSRIYAITLLILSPNVIVGGLILLETVGTLVKRLKRIGGML